MVIHDEIEFLNSTNKITIKMQTKEMDDEEFSLVRYIKMYFLVFGGYFLITSLALGFSIWTVFHFYGEDGMIVYGMTYSGLGVILGGVFSFSILLRSSAIFAGCNLIRFLIAYFTVFFIWVCLT